MGFDIGRFSADRLFNNSLSSFSFNTVTARYVRLSSISSSRDVDITEFIVSYDYTYIWTPGSYLTTDGASAIFDAGNLEMPTPNPISYTLSATLGTCTYYEQVSVAVIEARAGEDYCGPRTIGEPDRTPNIQETYSWVKIVNPEITTGTGDFIGTTNENIVPVSNSTGGDVAYELTTTYTFNGSTAVCRDTVIVPSGCLSGCDIVTADGSCPDFDGNNPSLTGIPPNIDDPANWNYSWTSNEGMVGLDNYSSQTVNLTDSVTRRYYVTFTNIFDTSYTCVDSIDANSAAYSQPEFTADPLVTTCSGTPVNIGNPANNPGLSYQWTNSQLLDDATISYPQATVNGTTEFIVTVTDVVTGCMVKDTVIVEVLQTANAGPDLVVCDNATLTIGDNTEIAGYTYSWSPQGADWRAGTDENDAMPDVFVATTQTFTLTTTDPSNTCVTVDEMTVTVENLPPTFTLPDLTYCPSQIEDLVLGTNNGTNTGTNLIPTGYIYSWSPSMVSSITAINPIINAPLPSNPMTYEVIVRNLDGCNVKATQTIIPITDAPLIESSKTICLGEAVQIGDSANLTSGGETYSWSPSVGLDDATAVNPIYTPSATGTTTFTLTKTVSGCSSTAEVTITVDEAIAPTLTPHTICAGESVEIGVANNQNLSYDWFPTTDINDATIANPTFSGGTSTNYKLIIINNLGCIAEANTSVTVNPMPTYIVTNPDIDICDADATSILIDASINSSSGSFAYQWSPVDFLDNPNVLKPTFYIPEEGIYEYVLEVTDQSTGCSIAKNMQLSVDYCLPIIDIGTSETDICVGESIELSAMPNIDITYYQWQYSTVNCSVNFSDITGANTATYTTTALSEDTYYRVKGYNSEGALITTSDCIDIKIHPSTSVVLIATADNYLGEDNNSTSIESGENIRICGGNDVLLTPLISGKSPYLYEWSHNSSNLSSQVVSPSTVTNYIVSITDGNGCVASDDIDILAEDCSECVFNISTTQPIYNDQGTPNDVSDDTFSFSIQVQGNSNYGWTDGMQSRDYGEIVSYGPYPVDMTGVNFEIRDLLNVNCQSYISINMSSCTYLETCTCCKQD